MMHAFAFGFPFVFRPLTWMKTMHAAADAAVGEYVAMTDSYCMGRETSFFSSLLPIARVEVVVVFCTTIINFNM